MCYEGQSSEKDEAVSQGPGVFELPLLLLLPGGHLSWLVISLNDHLPDNFRKCFTPIPALYLRYLRR